MQPGESVPSRHARSKAVPISIAASLVALVTYIVYRLDGDTFCMCVGFR